MAYPATNPNADMPNFRRSKFQLGKIVATPGALDALSKANTPATHFLVRHVSGDWGDLDDDDKRANDLALVEGTRLLSAYKTKAGDKLWIITEHDRSVTTILLPSDY